MMRSIQPPKYPAVTPIAVPMTAAIAGAIVPSRSDVRAP